MAVKKMQKSNFMLLTILLAFSNPVFSGNQSDKSVVLNLIKKRVTVATKELGERIKYCTAKKKSRPKIILNQHYLGEFKRHNILIGITHLNFYNSYRCQKIEKLQLAYWLGIFNATLEHYKVNTGFAGEINKELVYPSINEIKIESEYIMLPSKLKQYLEKQIGKVPFDFVKVLNENKLTNAPDPQ